MPPPSVDGGGRRHFGVYGMDLIGFLIVIIVALVVLYCLNLLLAKMKMDDSISRVILILVGLIFLLAALERLGIVRRFW